MGSSVIPSRVEECLTITAGHWNLIERDVSRHGGQAVSSLDKTITRRDAALSSRGKGHYPNRPGDSLIAILSFLVKRQPSARPEELSNADW